MTDSAQPDEIKGKSGGSPLDDPPELTLEVPEEVQQGPAEQASAEASPAANADEPAPGDEGDDPEIDSEAELSAPEIAVPARPDLEGVAQELAAAEGLAAFSSLTEVVANELENRVDSAAMGLDGDKGADSEAPAADDAEAQGYDGAESDMIDPDAGIDLMTALAGMVMRDAVPVDFATMSDPKKWRYDENPLKQLAEREKAAAADPKREGFRANARTVVAASAAVLALVAARAGQAQDAAPSSSRAQQARPAAARMENMTEAGGAAAVAAVPAQEKAPVPMAGDGAQDAARRSAEQAARQQAQQDERMRQEQDAAQAADGRRQRQLDEQQILRNQTAFQQAEQQQRDHLNRMIALEMLETMRPESVSVSSAMPEALSVDPFAASADAPALADASGAATGPGLSVAAPAADTGIWSVLSLFRDNGLAVTAPAWATPDRPGWETALDASAPGQSADLERPAPAAPAQNGPDMFKA